MEIVFLGTGAALPTQRRWPSATALVRAGEILLFDCGEGTQIRFQKAQLRPGRLSKIFISHLHGDHFYGLIGFLTSQQLLGREKPLELYGPKGLGDYLRLMQTLSRFSFVYEIVVHEVDEKTREKVWDLGDYHMTAMPLEHGIFTLGFRLEEKPKPGKFMQQKAAKLGIPEGPVRGRLQKGETVRLPNGREVKPSEVLGPQRPGEKVSICLDTRPCKNSVHLADGADLLIHDGSFDDSRRVWAGTTGHSTVMQAAEIAKEAGVEKLVLSHISARYKEADEGLLLDQARTIFPNTALAQDLKRIVV